jgi:large repetitive protein
VVEPTAVTLTTTQTNVLCKGQSNGTATVTANGGTTPYTYLWSAAAQSTAMASGLAAGTYTVTVTDGNMCKSTKSVTITEPADLTATFAKVNIFCAGATNASITVTPTGGTSPYTYAWSPVNVGSTEAGGVISGLNAGSKMITVTDANGCTFSFTTPISSPTAITAGVTVTAPTCFGGTNGSALFKATGGATPNIYKYNWGTPLGIYPTTGFTTAATSTQNRMGLAAGQYVVTVTNNETRNGAMGCPTPITVTVTQPTEITVTPSQTNVLCKGAATGSITVTSTGGTGTHNYVWSTGATGATVSGLVAGTYTVTATDANSCTKTSTVTITEPASVVTSSITASTNVLCNGAATGAATAAGAGGVAPYTYAWSNAASTDMTTGLVAGVYTVTVTDANGCTSNTGVTITEPTAVSITTTTVTNVSCFGGANGSATVNATGGVAPFTYAWGNGQTTATATGLAAGTFTVTATDANGCTITTSVGITEPAAALSVAVTTVTNVSCFGGADGSATVAASNGTAPYTYAWSNSATGATATGLIAGTFTVTATDTNGCTISTTAMVTEPTAVTLTVTTVTNVGCFGAATGSATVGATGGTAPYTYVWSNSATGATATGLIAGTYGVTATDSKGCTITTTATVTEPSAPLAATSVKTNVSCFGGANGTATVTATGGTTPYTYLWSNNAATAMISGLTGTVAGTAYRVTVTDANGCTTSSSVTVTQPTAITATTTRTNVKCNGETNGSITVTTTGGTSPYTYTWSPNTTGTVSGNVISGLGAGIKSITVTDANGCTLSPANVTITQPNAIALSFVSVTEPSCFGGSNGQVKLKATGGASSSYTYNWGTVGTPSTATSLSTITTTGLAAGTYNVTVTSGSGPIACTGVVTVTVGQPTQVAGTTAVTNATCRGGATGSVTVTPTGGTPGYTVTSSVGTVSGMRVSGLAAGTYTFTVTDSKGCTGTTTATVGEPAQVNASATTCSRAATGLTLNNPAAATYNILSVTLNGLTAVSGNASGTGLSASAIANDKFINTTSAAVNVVYSIAPVSADGCVGLPDVVTITVNPEPGAPTLTTIQRCSGTPYTVDATNLANNLAGTTFSWTAAASNPIFVNPAVTNGTNQTAITGNYTNLSTSDVFINYSVTATSAQGCVAPPFTITVTLNGQPQVTIASLGGNKVCKDAPRDLLAIALGGGAPYTYNWASSYTNGAAGSLNDATLESPTFIGTAPGKATFNVTVTDANGCVVASAPYNLTINDTPSFSSVSVTNVNCFGGATGQIMATGTGGNTSVASPSYTYQLNVNPFQASGTFSSLSPGTYTVVVKDGNGCTNSQTSTITQPSAALTSTLGTQTNVSCNGGTDGSVTLNAAGGTSPYTYAAGSGTAAGNVISGLAAGTYNVTVTDANSCTYTVPVNITEPAALNLIVATQTNVACNGGTNGAVVLSANGGSTPYEYSKDGGAYQTSPNFTALAAGTYSFSVKDAKMCTKMISVTITEPAAMTINATPTNLTCNGAANGAIAAAVSGGTAPYEYKFSATSAYQATASASGLAAGTYDVTAKDANGCTVTTTVTLTEPAAVAPMFASPALSVQQGSSQVYTLTSTYANYAWGPVPSGATVASGGNATSNNVTYNFSSQGTKIVSVTVTDVAGCTGVAQITVEVVPFVLVTPKAKLQGNFNAGTGLMTDLLRTGGWIPAAQPYTLPQVNNSGTETVAPSVLAVTGSDAIVDWVFVQLRSNANSATVISTRSALLQRDGDIVDVDGVSPLKMIVPAGTTSCFVTVKHRNHLGVMTAAPVALSSATTTVVDFTNPATATWTDGTNAPLAGTTTKLMRAGNANGNRNVRFTGLANDNTTLLNRIGNVTTNVLNGYYLEDLNMNGQVRYEGLGNDKTILTNTVGASTPDNVITEQTPN